MKRIIALIEKSEQLLGVAGLSIASVSIVFMMAIEVANAIGRKLLKPVPVTIETAESLMITTIFMAVGYVALKEEHTYVSLITRKMRPSSKRYMDALGQFIGGLAFGFLAWGAWEIAWSSMMQLEVRIGVIRFPIWIFRLFFAVGLTLFTLQLFFNALKFLCQALDPNWEDWEVMLE